MSLDNFVEYLTGSGDVELCPDKITEIDRECNYNIPIFKLIDRFVCWYNLKMYDSSKSVDNSKYYNEIPKYIIILKKYGCTYTDTYELRDYPIGRTYLFKSKYVVGLRPISQREKRENKWKNNANLLSLKN